MLVTSVLAGLWVVTHELLLLSAILIVLFAIDELVVDAIYLFARAKRLLLQWIRPRWWTSAHVPRGGSQRFAIFVPAWDEGEVVGHMLAHLTRTLEYGNYDVFVGTYPNDPVTRSAAADVKDRRIRLVTTRADGPTTKADCLNALWDAMLAAERTNGLRYAGVVLHDAEDIVHPAELDVFAYMIPRKALVQLPVFPIVDKGSRWVSGHYCDEFAEAHGKTLIVRETIGAALPSAGVACAFERTALGQVAEERGGHPFNAASMTEDYELGIRVSRIGGGAFVRLPCAAGAVAVATHEHFPATLDAALRQKTRWLVGIAFQGWHSLGWAGSLADKYMFLRDRKPVVNGAVILFAYLGVALWLTCALLRWWRPEAAAMPAVVEPGSGLWRLLILTSAILLWRLLIRAVFTTSVYGFAEGMLSIPRTVVANAIGVVAAGRAARIWLRHILRGQRIRWDKTAHRFPDEHKA